MKFGIQYLYWRNDLQCTSYVQYVARAKKTGFDVLELGDYLFITMPEREVDALAKASQEYDVAFSLCIDPPSDCYLTSSDPTERDRAFNFFCGLFPRMCQLNIKMLGGNMLNAPFRPPFSQYHQQEWEYGVKTLRRIAERASEYGISIAPEVVNRYESHIFNTARNAVKFLNDVSLPNVKLTLDTYHMNIEESSFANAIISAGDKLGHLHFVENHRGLPGSGHLPWPEIRDALQATNYQGVLSMECFVRAGGELGDCLRLWRDMSDHADEEMLDNDAKQACAAMRYLFANGNR